MIRVSANEDDAEESGGGAVKINEPDLDFGQQLVGVRFRDVGIPPGATILGAKVQFTASQSDTGGITLEIHGEAADDAAPFSAVSGNLSGRAPTMNTVSWMPPNWTDGDALGAQLTPDLKDVVQEIVNRPGWDSVMPSSCFSCESPEAPAAHGPATGAPISAPSRGQYMEVANPVGPITQVCVPPGLIKI
jgi:hypothetical protein